MAQSDSCPNPDLLIGALVHSPQGMCSDLGTQRGRDDEEGEEEDEEVELAEEVGEDALMTGGGGGGGEGQSEGESGEQSEREEVRITQGALLPSEGINEGEGGVETGNKEHGMIEGETGEDEGEDKGEGESKDKDTTIENPCRLSTLIAVEGGEERDLESNREEEEDGKEEESTQETEVAEDEIRDEVLEDYQAVANTDDEQHVEDAAVGESPPESSRLSTGDNTDAVAVPAADKGMEVEGPAMDVTPASAGIKEPVDDQDVRQASTVSDRGGAFATIEGNQTNQSNGDEDQSSQSGKQEVESIGDGSTWRQREDCGEGSAEDEGNEFVQESMSSHDVLVGEEEEREEEEAESTRVSSEEQSQREGGIEETVLLEEEQGQPMEWGGHGVGEEGEAGGDAVDVEEEQEGGDDLETHEEKNAPEEIQAPVERTEAAVERVEEEEEPVDTQQDVGSKQAEEVRELQEKGGEVEPEEPGVDVTAEEGGDVPEERPVEEAGTDVGERLRALALVEDETGGGAEEEVTEGEAEAADEPVTVLDDETEGTVAEPEEQKPATVADPPEDTAVQSKVEEYRVEGERVEGSTENEEKEKGGEGEVETDERPKEDHNVTGLTPAMENGILSPEPQPIRKEERQTAREFPPRDKGDGRIEDQPEGVRDGRRELRPVSKDGVSECARGGREERDAPRNRDWITELKSVIKSESLPRRRDEQVKKKKRVVLLEDGRAYLPRREEANERREEEEVKLISHGRAGSPSPPGHGDGGAPRGQDYEISLYVKVINQVHTAGHLLELR